MPSPSAASEFVVNKSYDYDRRSAPRWIISHLLRNKIWIGGLIIGAFANGALAAVVPTLIGIAFNVVLRPQPDLSIIATISVLAFVSQVIRAVLQFLRNASAETLGQRMERDMRDEMYASLLGKSMTFHSMQSVGDVMARATNDVHEINLMFNPGVNLVIGSAMFMLFPLALSPSINPQLLLTPVLFTLAYIGATTYFVSKLHPATQRVRASFGDMNARLAEALDGIEIVKGASQEQQEIAVFHQNANNFRDAFVRQSDIESQFIPLLLLGIAIGSAFLHALLLYHAGVITIGNVVTYMGFISLYGFPVFISLFGFSNISLGLAAANRILSLIVTKTELDENLAGHSASIVGNLTFEDVSFSYYHATPALKHVSFSAKAGQIIAIVGQTGAGKSTLARLINRTYDPTAGQVLIDGVDIRTWQLESLRSQISIIEQDIFLFSRTIAENIAFGVPGATRDQIEDAARGAQAHEFIMAFRDGYETIVGERGVTLSGGQRQRIALARAFLTNPRILILDDSTSAIDSATEDQIQRAIHHATQGRTTILITHRLSQIRWADQIVVLRLGEVVAVGTHDELMQRSESYRRIFAAPEADNRPTKFAIATPTGITANKTLPEGKNHRA